MSDDAQSDINKSTNKIHKLPFIIKKEAIKTVSNCGMLFRRGSGISVPSNNIIKEDVIYKAQDEDFFKGKYPDLCIINKVDVVKNSSRTAAAYTANGSVVNLTSDAVVKTIGQENYDQVFTALCCVFNQELKIKGILALLHHSVPENERYSAKGTQTYDSSFKHLLKLKQRIRHNKRKRVRSYIVEDRPQTVLKNAEHRKLETVPKRVLINPADFMEQLHNIKVEPEDLKTESLNKSIEVRLNDTETNDTSKSLEADVTDNSIVSVDKLFSDIKQTNTGDSDLFPELKLIVDEDSNISEVGSVSHLSIGSCFSLSNIEGKTKAILNYIEEHTKFNVQCQNVLIECVDGSMIKVKGNPDPFHIATPEILNNLSPMDQKKIMLHQAYLDWKFCMQRNEDDNLPIHLAVLDNDVALLKRQCLVLKSRHESVDIPASGNLTALQMSIFQDCPECTAVLLAHGADLLIRDDEARTPLHLAAEISANHVEAILEHCRNNARTILKRSDSLWKPELENKSEPKLVDYLLTQLNTICDNQGYTPLMLASKLGNAAVVELLVAVAPSTINMAMPSCGNTALYLAAGAACTEAANHGDKTTIPENYKRVVECLVEHGADPSIENNSGSNVNSLLSELSDVTLSCIISVKMCKLNGYGNKVGDVMLVKDDKGTLSVISTKNSKGVKNDNEVNSELKVCQPKKVYTKSSKNITEARTEVVEVMDTKNTQKKQDTEVARISEINNSCSSKSSLISSKSFISETNKPVIVKNLPVITKIVKFNSKRPVLVKHITSKKQDDKGLKTQITAKPATKVHSVFEPPIVPLDKPVGSKTPQYLKILPKTGSEAITGVMHFKNVFKRPKQGSAQSSGSLGNIESSKPKFLKILPKPDSETTSADFLKLQSATKRPACESNSSAPSPMKKPKN